MIIKRLVKISFSLIVLLSFFVAINGFAQFHVLKNFTVNDGLPSSSVYDMLQDTTGVIWFATESGVCSFDGRKFENYTVEDGLPANSTVKLNLDSKGRVWFLSFEGFVSWYENNHINSHWINDTIKHLPVRFFQNVYVDSLDNQYFSPYYGGLLKVDNQSRSIEFDIMLKRFRIFDRRFFYSEDNFGQVMFMGFPDKFPTYNLVKNFKKTFQIDFKKESALSYLHRDVHKYGKDKYIVSCGPLLYQVIDGEYKLLKTYDEEIIDVFVDIHDNLWVSLNFSGIEKYPDMLVDNNPDHFFPDQSITKIIQDREGGFWFSSTENGVYYVPSIQFNCLKNEGLNSNVVYRIGNTGNQIFFSTGSKGFYKAEIQGENIKIDHSFKLRGYINSNINEMFIDYDGALWLSSTEYLKYDQNGNPISLNTDRYHSLRQIIQLHDKSILAAYIAGMVHYPLNSSPAYSITDDNFALPSFTVAEDMDSTIWIGTVYGLYKNVGNDYLIYDSLSPVLNSRISSLLANDQGIWVGTFDKGLAFIKEGNTFYISEKSGLPSNRIKVISQGQDGAIWIGSNQGLTRIIINDYNLWTYQIENYTIWEGLPSNEINDIHEIGNLIWLATNKGLVNFNPDKIEVKSVKPLIYLSGVYLNNSDSNYLYAGSNFRYNENNVTFSYYSISYKNPEANEYLYRLDGFENEWIKTKNNTVRYSNLTSGDYSFRVLLVNSDGFRSDEIVYNFMVREHFTEMLFVRILFFLLLFGFVLFGVKYFIQLQRKREELARQIILAEQKAVRSQMNPHFIFNALNSIQNFILDKDEENANIYLVIFSKLIRRILESTKHNFISLSEEIETIKLYLELEKFRFDKKFEYNITIHPMVNADHAAIPSMILQPYLENAIWHGLVPKGGEGKVDINVDVDSSHRLYISITDNGIGRDKAANISRKRKFHKPTGMKNVEERLNLLNNLNKTKMKVEIIDLFDKNSEPCGTRVEFYIDT